MRGRLWATVAAAVFVGLVVLVASSQSADEVSVYPTAGTPVASPSTQVSFRGIRKKGLTGLEVKGSRTGVHGGRLAAHSDGKGASFLPFTPFAPGETVSVRADQPLVGEKDGAVTFKILTPVAGLRLSPKPDAGGTSAFVQHFRTEPGLRPPSIKVLTDTGRAAPGYLMAGPKTARGQDGAMIADKRGRTVWFHPAPTGTSVYDFRAQRYEGRPVLTWWEGRVLFAKGYGHGVIYDDSYRQIATVEGANGYSADLHEFQLTPHGSAFVTEFQPVSYDLTSVGGPQQGTVFDSIVQEIDVKTGLVLFEWHSIGHIPFTESYARYSGNEASPYDPYHLNTVEEEPGGRLLISARNTNAAYELERSTGKVRWTLGGKNPSYKEGPGTGFVAQHDVRRQRDGTVTVFDNGSGVPGVGKRPARGVVLKVDDGGRKVTVSHALERSQPVTALSQGNLQALANGDYLAGWGGGSPYLTEFSRGGHVVFDARFDPVTYNSYRSYRFPWHARPFYPPRAAAAVLLGGNVRVSASWNGATDVASWDVLAGATRDSLRRVASVPRRGFETSTALTGAFRFVAVRARARSGTVLGTSAPVPVIR